MTKALPPNRLQELREAHGLVRVEVAAICKVGERTIRRWEDGSVAIPDQHKLLLAEYFAVDVAYLMGWDREPLGSGRAAA